MRICNYCNIVKTLEKLIRIVNYLMKEFEMTSLRTKILSWLINQVFPNQMLVY